MRPLRYLLGTCIVGLSAIITSAFSYFIFSSNSSSNATADTNAEYINNIKFDENSTEDSDRTYTLYFFASPYYATGTTESITSNTNALTELADPLDIAESDNNPYISTDSYCITSYTALTSDEDKKYANYIDSDGNYRYISTPDYNPSAENYDGTKLSSVTSTYQKVDYYGTVEADGEAIDSNNDYVTKNGQVVYYKVTVQDSIKYDVLSNIIAKTVFKNRYGFSPEFMGWTYDKQACFERVCYSSFDGKYHRYYNNSVLSVYNDLKMSNVNIDSDTNTTTIDYSSNPDQIGNYGANSYIPILSSDDSLYGIDNNAKDGSEANDKVIYLYPVFGDRTISTSTTVTKAPILKMLSNPDTDETKTITVTDSDGNTTTETIDNPTYYKYHEEGENDYTVGTNGVSTTTRKATFLNYDSSISVSSGTTVTKPNYTLKNFYVNQIDKDKDDNFANYYLLEVLTVDNTTDSYSSSWNEVFDNTKLIDLFNISDTSKKEYFENYVNSYCGTFDVDIILSQENFSFDEFENDELYINNPEKKTLTFNNGITIYYVIGLKRNNSLKLTGLGNNLMDYDSQKINNYFTKTSYVNNQGDDSSYWHYYTCNPFTITLSNGETSKKLSALIKDGFNYFVNSNNKFTLNFQGMTGENKESGVLGYFNNAVSNSNLKNKTKFISASKKKDIYAYQDEDVATEGSVGTETKSITNFPIIECKNSGTYELLIAIKYSNGFPSDMQVAFRDYTEVCNLLVLSEKPTSAVDDSGNYLYSSITSTYKDSILLEGEFSLGETITKSTKFGSTQFSKILNDSTYSNKELYDLATGQKVKDLITNNNFVLSRNMILYYE